VNPPAVSILIVNWNTREVLRDCLRTVYEQTKNVPFEVIVVDNASEDGSVDMVKTAFPQVVLLANATNRGFAAANNQGIEAAKGRYVLLLNSDTLVLDGAIDKMVGFAEEHAQAAAVACRVLNPDRTWQPTCFLFPSALNLLIGALYLNKIFPRNRFFGRERMTWWDGQDTRAVDVVTGCFILVRREIVDKVGVLDESYFMYGEEADWCYRFQKAGWKVLYTPIAQIVHLGGASSARAKGPMCLQLRASILLFLRKHRSRASYVAACLFVSLFFLLRLPLWLAKAATSGKARSEHWQTVRTYAAGFWRALYGWRALCVKK
jgi:GT2 family glycosyltransferase